MTTLRLPYAEDLPVHPDWAMDWLRERWEAARSLPEIDIDLSDAAVRSDLVGGALRPVTLDDGRIDRSKTLFLEGLKLARRGATPEEIVATLRDLDEGQGFQKYSRRRDGGIKAYSRIAQKAASPKADGIPGGEMSWDEITQLVGSGQSHPLYHTPDVRINVKGELNLFNANSDKPRESLLWKESCELFPAPKGRPLATGAVLWDEHRNQMHVIDLFSNSWRNEVNACFNRRKLYYNGVRALSKGDWYAFDVPADEWTQRYRDSLAKSVKRADGQHVAFNYLSTSGFIRGIASVPISGSVPVSDPQAWLLQALRGTRPPELMSKGRRFQALWGTRALKKEMNRPIDRSKQKLHLVAKSRESTDYPLIEANLREANLEYAIQRPILKQQVGYGISARMRNWEHAEEFLRGLPSYRILNRRV